MIFLSHTKNDKPVVRQIAETLVGQYGKENVFYDEWSIQPGDSIIQKMDDGLSKCQYFFYFLSENSLKSKMVELEWQSALIKQCKEGIKFIPVRVDKSIVPQILTHTLYIDLFSQGLKVATRQIIDVINGENTYKNGDNQFHNIIGYVSKKDGKVIIEFRAEYYMEPHSNYLILVDNEEEEIAWKLVNKTMFISGFHKELVLDNGTKIRGAINISNSEATSPNFPFVVELTPTSERGAKVLGLMRAVAHNQFAKVPMRHESSTSL